MLDSFLLSEATRATMAWLQDYGIPILVVIFVAWFSYHLVHFIMDYIFKRIIRKSKFNNATDLDIEKRQKTLASLSTTVIRVTIIIATFIILLQKFLPDINFAPLFASAGIIGVALGFGAQSLIKDFLTGVFIISENQYRVGDVVDIKGAAGTVEKVGIRSTVIRDVHGNVHYMPNGIIDHVINKSMDFSKVNFTLSVQPETNVEKLTKVINEVGEKLAEDPKWKNKVIEPPHFLNISNFTHYGMDIIIVGVTQPSEQWSVSGELRRRLMSAFRKHKIELAVSPAMLAIGQNTRPSKK